MINSDRIIKSDKMRVIPRYALREAINGLAANPEIYNFNRDAVKLAYRKWADKRWSEQPEAVPCKEKDDRFLAVQCRCPGCVERLCFLYFDQVAARLGTTK